MRRARIRSRILWLLPICLPGLVLGGCAVNPATGERIMTFGKTIEDERQIGARQHPIIIRQFGGIYDNPQVTKYVAQIGANLARVSELPNIRWRFTVLNSEKVNAFALPGGFVYVTRGLIALANNEAELAGVIAHEIGHVTARHFTQRQWSGTLAEAGATAAGLFLGSPAGAIANFVGHGIVQQYSQGQEFQADKLGVRYISRLGYEASMMARFLAKMRAHSALQNRIKGRPEGEVDRGNFFASHPRTLDRVHRAIAEARGTQTGKQRNREQFLRAIDGMLFAADPNEGILIGRNFTHPVMGFSFTIPSGFKVQNRPAALTAAAPGGLGLKFDVAGKHANTDMQGYIRREWVPGRQLTEIESMTVNGMKAATARTRINDRHGTEYDIRFVAIRRDAGRIFRFIFHSPPELTQKFSLPFRRTTFSMRSLTPEEAAGVRPLRIRVHIVQAGETISQLAGRMAMERFGGDWFQVLNRLRPRTPLLSGTPVKLVTR